MTKRKQRQESCYLDWYIVHILRFNYTDLRATALNTISWSLNTYVEHNSFELILLKLLTGMQNTHIYILILSKNRTKTKATHNVNIFVNSNRHNFSCYHDTMNCLWSLCVGWVRIPPEAKVFLDGNTSHLQTFFKDRF